MCLYSSVVALFPLTSRARGLTGTPPFSYTHRWALLPLKTRTPKGTRMDPNTLSNSQKLDFLESAVADEQKSQAKLKQLVTLVQILETKVAEQDCIIAYLQGKVRFLKERDNFREQQTRSNTLRLFNFPGSNDETNLTGKVYEELLKPILAAAKAQGDITTLPQVNNTLDAAPTSLHRQSFSNSPLQPSDSPSSTLEAQHSSPLDNSKRMVLTEDLTQPTHHNMRDLLDDNRVAKVWSLNGSLWHCHPMHVKSIYDSKDKILS